MESLVPKKQIEIQPYSVGKLETYHENPENPFSKGKEPFGSVGLDGKVGITNDLTLDFTVNPDFGQVEADPSEVNLSSFESYFPEQRPFFVEGKNIMSFQLTPGNNGASSDNLFYSRRIGRSPQVWPDDYDYEKTPQNTTILGAAKLTGKTKNGLSIGVLESVTGKEKKEFVYQGVREKMTSEPATNYFVSRLQKDFNKGKTRIGAMLTASNRDLGKAEDDFLHKAAYTGGLDYNLSWKEKTYQVNMKLYGSRVEGSREALIRTQESGVHYFQRPDAHYIQIDSSRTSLMGHGGIIDFSKSGNGHWSFGGWINWRSPGLELNDVGYLCRADDIFQVSWANYRVWEPKGIIKSFSINFNQWTGWDFGGNSTYKGGNTGININFLSGWYFGSGINIEGNDLDYSALKGGPSLLSPGNFNYWSYLQSDARKKLWFEINPYGVYGFNNYLVRNGVSFGINYQPSQTVLLNVSPGFSKQVNNFQYVDQSEFQQQNQYILGTLNQKTFRLSFRAEFSISPELTIQYYGQPFISAGKYSKFKKVIAAKAKNYNERFSQFDAAQLQYIASDEEYVVDENMDGTEDYRFSNPDFKALYFLSNMVLRWEYKPGSTLFLVWSQNRDNYTNDGKFSFSGDMKEMYSIFPGNVFLIKFSYRFMS